MQSINGYSYSKMRIVSGGDTPTTTTVNLPLTNREGGLEETISFRQVTHELLNLDDFTTELAQLPIGYDITFTYHYEGWITGDNLYNVFLPILRGWKNQRSLFLTPRIDVQEREFEVKLINETLTLKLAKATQNNIYHKGAMFVFKTRYTQSDPGWILTPLEAAGGGTINLPMEG